MIHTSTQLLHLMSMKNALEAAGVKHVQPFLEELHNQGYQVVKNPEPAADNLPSATGLKAHATEAPRLAHRAADAAE